MKTDTWTFVRPLRGAFGNTPAMVAKGDSGSDLIPLVRQTDKSEIPGEEVASVDLPIKFGTALSALRGLRNLGVVRRSYLISSGNGSFVGWRFIDAGDLALSCRALDGGRQGHNELTRVRVYAKPTRTSANQDRVDEIVRMLRESSLRLSPDRTSPGHGAHLMGR